jgi:hypothetical protein
MALGILARQQKASPNQLGFNYHLIIIIIYQLSIIIYQLSIIIYQLSFIIYHLSIIIYYMYIMYNGAKLVDIKKR